MQHDDIEIRSILFDISRKPIQNQRMALKNILDDERYEDYKDSIQSFLNRLPDFSSTQKGHLHQLTFIRTIHCKKTQLHHAYKLLSKLEIDREYELWGKIKEEFFPKKSLETYDFN